MKRYIDAVYLEVSYYYSKALNRVCAEVTDVNQDRFERNISINKVNAHIYIRTAQRFETFCTATVDDKKEIKLHNELTSILITNFDLSRFDLTNDYDKNLYTDIIESIDCYFFDLNYDSLTINYKQVQ